MQAGFHRAVVLAKRRHHSLYSCHPRYRPRTEQAEKAIITRTGQSPRASFRNARSRPPLCGCCTHCCAIAFFCHRNSPFRLVLQLLQALHSRNRLLEDPACRRGCRYVSVGYCHHCFAATTPRVLVVFFTTTRLIPGHSVLPFIRKNLPDQDNPQATPDYLFNPNSN